MIDEDGVIEKVFEKAKVAYCPGDKLDYLDRTTGRLGSIRGCLEHSFQLFVLGVPFRTFCGVVVFIPFRKSIIMPIKQTSG